VEAIAACRRFISGVGSEGSGSTSPFSSAMSFAVVFSVSSNRQISDTYSAMRILVDVCAITRGRSVRRRSTGSVLFSCVLKTSGAEIRSNRDTLLELYLSTLDLGIGTKLRSSCNDSRGVTNRQPVILSNSQIFPDIEPFLHGSGDAVIPNRRGRFSFFPF